MNQYEKCERCDYFKVRQGKGILGECRKNPPVMNLRGNSEFPTVKPTLWCGSFEVNLDKYHINGKKIYTRVDTVLNTPDNDGSIYND